LELPTALSDFFAGAYHVTKAGHAWCSKRLYINTVTGSVYVGSSAPSYSTVAGYLNAVDFYVDVHSF
jgi:hypothetical protein